MKDFTQGNILKHLIIFALPIVISNLIQSIYTIIDGIWVGQLLGHEAFAAVSTSQPVVFFMVSILIGVGIATSILAGQSYGAKNMEALSKVLFTSFFTSLLLVVCISGSGILWSDDIINLINTPSNIKESARIFLVIILEGMIFNFIYQWFTSVLNGIGDSKTPTILLIISVILNIALAPLFIVGYGPVPAMGIAGSALATVFSNCVINLIAFFIIRKHTLLQHEKFNLKFDFDIFKKMISIAVPSSLQMLTVSLASLLIVSLVNKFGENVTAAFGVGMRIDQFSMFSSMAISTAASAMTSQNLGAGKNERVDDILKFSVMIAMAIALLFFAIVMIWPELVASIFTSNKNVIAHSVDYFRWSALGYIGFAILFTYQGVIRGSGDALNNFMIVAFSILVFRLPLSYCLSEFTPLKELGLWVAMPISVFVGALGFYFYYQTGNWKKKVVIRTQPEPAN